MTYTPVIPQSGESLGSTRDRIRTNFEQISSVFGNNHYTFDALGEGKHQKVQTPDQVSDVASAANEPVLYAKASSNAGVLQYSRGPSNAAPTPITSLQSVGAIPCANNASIPVLDFAGLPLCMAMIYAFDNLNSTRKALAFVWWDGAVLSREQLTSSTSSIRVDVASPNLSLFNNNTASAMSIYWTLDFKRLS